MKEKNVNERNRKTKQNESAPVTKESIAAVCALFSFLILLILCTNSLIFGEIGRLTQDFFLGTFGYFAYPLLACGLYSATAVFLDFRLIKNRRSFAAIAATLIFVALLLQTVFTYSWATDGYAVACFVAGENFSTATLLGWCGGILISALTSTIGKIGALIVFSLLSLLGTYVIALTFGKKPSVRERREKTNKKREAASASKKSGETNAEETKNVVSEPTSAYPPMERESFSGSAYSYAPKPSVIINENDYYSDRNRPVGGGFSPFSGYQQPRRTQAINAESSDVPSDSEGRRKFLLSGSPAEIYRKNLIFDDNASVNKRRSETGNASNPTLQTSSTDMQSGFSSYTSAYEDGLNQGVQAQKIYSNETEKDAFSAIPSTQASDRTSYLEVREDSHAPRATEERDSFRSVESFARAAERDSGFGFKIDSESETERGDRFSGVQEENPEKILESAKLSGDEALNGESGRRHEFMDYFSLSNPNVFGNGREASDSDLRSIGRESSFETDRYSRGFSESVSREVNANSSRFEHSANIPAAKESLSSAAHTNEAFSEEEKTDALNIFDDEEPTPARETVVNPPSRTVTSFTDRGTTRDLQSISFRRDDSAQSKAPIENSSTEEQPVKKPRVYRPYVPAPLHYFDCSDIIPDADPNEVEESKEAILNVYRLIGISEISVASVSFGPTLTRYNLVFDRSIVPTRLVSKDIEASMAMALRAEKGVNLYLNYGEGVVSIEVPNRNRQTVQLGCMLTGSEYTDAKDTSLVFSIGKNVVNKKLYGDVCKMVHLLVAGSTGSGKSVFLNTLIISLINRYSPEQLRLILIDPKKTEFVIYNNLPHLMINEIITDPKKAIQSLNWAIGEMNRRYDLFAKMSKAGTRVVNVDEYNAVVKTREEKLPKIVIVVDELADLMLAAKKEVEERIQNITQKSRAAGIHMIIATQRPSTDVITGVIKANLSTRIAFMVASDVDSRVILDATGAQKLLGYGDMLYGTVGRDPTRAQCAFISSSDCQKVVDFIRGNNEAYFDEEATTYINSGGNGGGRAIAGDDDGEPLVEEVFIEALKMVIVSNTASISMIQRKCSVGYSKAGKIIEWMEDMGYISPYDGAKARKVLITKEEFEEVYGAI